MPLVQPAGAQQTAYRPVEPKARSDYAAMKPVVDAVAEGLSGTASEKVLQIHDFLTEKNT